MPYLITNLILKETPEIPVGYEICKIESKEDLQKGDQFAEDAKSLEIIIDELETGISDAIELGSKFAKESGK